LTLQSDGANAGIASAEVRNFNWLLSSFVDTTPGVTDAVAVSSDGLLMATSSSLERAGAEQLAAIIAGMTSLAESTARCFALGGFEQVIAEERGPIDTKARVNYENVAFKADYSPSDRISTFLRLGYFREEHVSILNLLASQIAIAIDNANIYESERHNREMLAMLYEVSLDMTSTLETEEVFHRIANAVKSTVNYHIFSIFQLDERTGVLQREGVLLDPPQALLDIGHDLLAADHEDDLAGAGGVRSELAAARRGGHQRSRFRHGVHAPEHHLRRGRQASDLVGLRRAIHAPDPRPEWLIAARLIQLGRDAGHLQRLGGAVVDLGAGGDETADDPPGVLRITGPKDRDAVGFECCGGSREALPVGEGGEPTAQ